MSKEKKENKKEAHPTPKTRAVYTNLSIPVYGQLKAISEARGTSISRTLSDLLEEHLVFLEQDPRAWKEKVEEHAKRIWLTQLRELVGAALLAAIEAGTASRVAGAALSGILNDRERARALAEEARRRSLAEVRQKVLISELKKILNMEETDDSET